MSKQPEYNPANAAWTLAPQINKWYDAPRFGRINTSTLVNRVISFFFWNIGDGLIDPLAAYDVWYSTGMDITANGFAGAAGLTHCNTA